MVLPNYQQAANSGLLGINEQASAPDVQWSPEHSALNLIFRRTDATPTEQMTDLTRQEMDAKLASSEAKVDARLANFDTSIKTGFAELATAMAKQSAAMEKQADALRIEMAKQSGDVRTEMAAIRAEMHKGTADLLKWGAGIAFAAVASTVGLLTYINKSAERLSPQMATQSPAPLVVAVPTGSAILTAPQVPSAVAPQPPKPSN